MKSVRWMISVALMGALASSWGCSSGGPGETEGTEGSGGSAGIADSDGGGGTGGGVADSGDGGETRTVGKVVVTPGEASFDEGDTFQLTAQVFDTEGERLEGVNVSFGSDNEEVAIVNEGGLITGIFYGEATITAKAGGKSATAAIEVKELAVARVEIVVPESAKRFGEDDEHVMLAIDHELNLEAVAYAENGQKLRREIEWKMAPWPEYAVTISPEGRVRAISPGFARIAAMVGDTGGVLFIGARHRFQAVAAGATHTCALSAGDRAWCWGSNLNGKLGSDDAADSNYAYPVAVKGEHSFKAIATGRLHSCALDTSGNAWCWGYGTYHSLGGDAADETARKPRLVEAGGVAFDYISVGGASSCAVTNDGKLYCWGQLNEKRGPERMFEDKDIQFSTIEVGGSGSFACAKDTENKVHCWGENAAQQVKSPASPFVSELTERPFSARSEYEVGLAVGVSHACVSFVAPDVTGTMVCWGTGRQGEVGDKDYPFSSSGHTTTTGGSFFEKPAMGLEFGCGILADGQLSVYCWGTNEYVQLGKASIPGDRTWMRTKIDNLSAPPGYKALTAGYSHACALSDEAEPLLYCWGRGNQGQLGYEESNMSLPRLVKGQVNGS